MKKINLLKSMLLLFTVLTLSNCEEDGAIQFIVVDDFSASVTVTGLEGQSSYTESGSTNISDLLEGASSFVEADVESITISLEDYSGTSIDGTVTVSAGSLTLINESVSLSTSPIVIDIPDNASDILNLISSGVVPITVSGTSTIPLEDNNFKINLILKVKAKIE